MSPSSSDWERIKALFNVAQDLPPAERADFLARECSDAVALRREVESLLAQHARGDSAGVRPGAAARALEGLTTAELPPLTERPGTVIGPYKLLHEIGEGGFGTVFMAEQEKPVRRRVALKIIKLGMDTKQVIARFEAERQALALMDHPSIARVLDAGATASGRPYFVMELVRGEPITRFCDERRLSIPERLALFEQVCQAVHHAHMKGVIHRDIKPTNVLVTVVDGDKPLAKIIDFGIAKATSTPLTERTLATGLRQLVGTLEYMSPEQADLSAMDIDTRSDVYTLGVLLYELLTGVTPIDGARLRSAALEELQRIIKEEDPPRPSLRVTVVAGPTVGRSLDEPEPKAIPVVGMQQGPPQSNASNRRDVAQARQTDLATLVRALRSDLDWIVMKCLEKDRTRRYESAVALAQDVRRYLSGDVVIAAPPSLLYRMRKLARRHRAGVAGSGLLALALLVALAGLWIGWNKATTGQDVAESALAEKAVALEQEQAQRIEAEWNTYVANLGHAQAAMQADSYPTARERLELCPEHLRGWEWWLLHRQAESFRGAITGVSESTQFDFSPDGQHVVATIGGRAQLFDSEGRPVGMEIPHDEVKMVGFSPTGQHFLTVSSALVSGYPQNVVRIWDLDGGSVGLPLQFDGGLVMGADGSAYPSVRFAPDGKRVLTIGMTHSARLWDLNGQSRGLILREDFPHPVVSAGITAEFNSDGTRLMTWSGGGWRLWDADGQSLGSATLGVASFSAVGKFVLSWTVLGAQVWDAYGQPVGAEFPHADCQGAGFSPDERHVATWSSGEVRIWTLEGEAVGESMPHEELAGVVFSPDGDGVLTYSAKHARVWGRGGLPVSSAMSSSGWLNRARFSPCGTRILLMAAGPHSIRLFDRSGNQVGSDLPNDWNECLQNARLDCLTTVSWPHGLLQWNYDGDPLSQPHRLHSWIVSPEWEFRFPRVFDRSTLWSRSNSRRSLRRIGDHSGSIVVIPVATWSALEIELLGPLTPATEVAGPGLSSISTQSPDGTRRAIATRQRQVALVAASSRREVATFHVDRPVKRLGFTSDGTRLLIEFTSGGAEVWDTRDADAQLAEWRARWAERGPATDWVDVLLAEGVPVNRLEERILADRTRSTLTRLVGLEVAPERCRWIESGASRVLNELRYRNFLPEDLARAVESLRDESLEPMPPGVRRAVRDELRQHAASWRPNAQELNNLAWEVVRHPGAAPERLAAALRAAEMAVQSEPSSAYIVNTLGVAQCRAGQYEAAVETLTRSLTLAGKADAADLAFLVIARAHLGQLEQARSDVALLKDLCSTTTDDKVAECRTWLAEAEAALTVGASAADSDAGGDADR